MRNCCLNLKYRSSLWNKIRVKLETSVTFWKSHFKKFSNFLRFPSQTAKIHSGSSYSAKDLSFQRVFTLKFQVIAFLFQKYCLTRSDFFKREKTQQQKQQQLYRKYFFQILDWKWSQCPKFFLKWCFYMMFNNKSDNETWKIGLILQNFQENRKATSVTKRQLQLMFQKWLFFSF